MKVFFDTSVLVASSVKSHEKHAGAFAAMQRVASGQDTGTVASHSLAELYAVLTRLPVTPRIRPEEAARIVVENVVKRFQVQPLGVRDYENTVAKSGMAGVTGGAIHDALLIAGAEKAQPERIYTFNVADFRRLAPQLSKVITAP